VTDDPSGPEQKRLWKRLRPFVLRRTKRLVATELPEKIIQVSYCELTDAQKKIYSELLGAARRQVSELAGAKDQGKRRIAVLTALLRLRQACCDLRLLGDSLGEKDDSSAKLDMLHEILGEAIDGGHRVLVFSQFVSMLKLARESLTEAGIDSCYLDGSTRDRGAVVDEFQNGKAPVFLISLKAGGTGLNLTAADTVVHFDPWWNPAVEDQATDRAHRIGQKNVVTAYKLVARDTVEEKILALQSRKRQLSDLSVESEQPLMEGLQMSELEELLG
ncbi:MAG: DEAD/DEAH box helicase, partial [Verrucomicrobiaceae bacterium]